MREKSFSDYSLYKQFVLNNLVSVLSVRHNRKVEEGLRHSEFVYVDAHGGLGFWKNSKGLRCLGSPVTTYRTLEKWNVPYRGFVFEKNEARCEKLKSHLMWSQYPVDCYNMDNLHAPDIVAEAFGGSACHIPAAVDDNHLRTKELGGLIYYDCDGHGSSSEIARLTQDNRLDVLLHFCTGKRSMYRHSKEQLRLVSELPLSEVAEPTDIRLRPVTAFTHNMDQCVVQHIDDFNRPYWYIGRLDLDNHNKFQFLFLFGTHEPLEDTPSYTRDQLSDAYSDKLGVHHPGVVSQHLTPIWSNDGVYQQHMAHYSKEDMRWFNTATNSMSADSENIGNSIPFNVVTGRISERDEMTSQLMDEGSLRVPQTTYNEDTIF